MAGFTSIWRENGMFVNVANEVGRNTGFRQKNIPSVSFLQAFFSTARGQRYALAVDHQAYAAQPRQARRAVESNWTVYE
jgi:hypothetical protein